MKKEIVIEGYAVEKDGKYWGWQYKDSKCSAKDYSSIENAIIIENNDVNIYQFAIATRKNMYNQELDKLQGGKLVKVRKTISYEII